MGMGGDEEDVHGKIDKKVKKKRKNKEVAKDRISDYSDIRVDDTVELRKEVKKKKRNHVNSDFEFDDIKNEVVNSKVLPKTCNSEGEKKKKTKHKIETEQVENEYLTSMELKSNDGFNSALEERRDEDKKKRHKEKRNKELNSLDDIDVNNGEELRKKKKRRTEKRGDVSSDFEGERSIENVEEAGKANDQFDGDAKENVEYVKKEKKRKKKKNEDYVDNELRKIFSSISNEKVIIEDKMLVDKEKEVETEDGQKKAKKHKRVQFSGNVEVFPSSDGPSSSKNHPEYNLVRGKRFSREEDEKVMEAVNDYIKGHGLGEEGLKMILNCKLHPEVKNCWKEIGDALPYRPYLSIYYRAHILFERDEKREYTTEELDYIRRYHEQNGSNWKALGEKLGKHRTHVKDAWRRVKLMDTKKGHWTQEEYQSLFDLVNADLQMKAFEEKQSKHGMLRDNICWGAISDNLGTRMSSTCCLKWYGQLISPMVAEGEWADVDDYHMLNTLFSLDACCAEDVDWDNLLEHRSGDVCRKRWNQMLKHIGEHRSKTFAEQVEILSKRYRVDVLEAREAYDGKPAVG